jgi:DNA-binding CsgD family transcriptional regulator
VPKILELVARNDGDESFSFFQQVRIAPHSREFIWHMSSLKIFMRNDEGIPILAITFSAPIDPEHKLTQKVSRLLDQNNFLRTHYQNFAKLGKRECEVLRLMALGKSTAEIAEELFIAVATVETHRKHIRKKLNIGSSYDLSQYAYAFNLI